MIFINPKIDFAFKKIFGSEDSKDILINFLNALIYEAQPIIQDLEILNPYLAPKIRGVKDTYLDIKAKIIDGEKREPSTVIIEMQVLNVEGFEKRILYNAAKSYSTQLKSGQSYSSLNPLIALTITDFLMFTELPNVTSRFILKERDFLVDYPIYDIELIFVELPKFKKNLGDLETIIDKWLYFLNNARSLEVIPTEMESIPEIKKAFYIANQINLSPDELEDQEKSEFFIQDQQAIAKATRERLEQGRQEGIQVGRQEGIQVGRQEGIQVGLEQGKQDGKKDLVMRLLTKRFGKLTDRHQNQISTLEITQLEELAEALLDFANISDLDSWLEQF
jgi:predicted transposase/invertase (TIGR01784 family)